MVVRDLVQEDVGAQLNSFDESSGGLMVMAPNS